MKDKIIFLDFDGVVNTPIWHNYMEDDKEVFTCKYAWPFDGFVNNYQAICWLNELYNDHQFDIVVTSSWRSSNDMYPVADCLYNGGLNKDIQIIDMLPNGNNRAFLIREWLKANSFIDGNYVILDDDDYYTDTCPDLVERFVKTDPNIGITIYEYRKIKYIFEYYSENGPDFELIHHHS